MKKFITIGYTVLLTLALSSASAMAAPAGYSINSDSGSGDADSLYRIDLASGAQVRLGRVQSLGQTRLDVEGLAFAPDGTLYGVDDESMKLFPINPDNGVVIHQQEVSLQGLPSGGTNDFGMTFACDKQLYVSSVATRSLYRVALDGTSTLVGAPGALGASISALAAFGSPVKLYGLSNGLSASAETNLRTLFSIDPQTGVASAIGQLGNAADAYNEAGLDFDSSGTLWALTDRRAVSGGPLSQILTINTATGVATAVANSTPEVGFESLAVTVPRGCNTSGGGVANFTVQKRYVDGNDITPVTLKLSCNGGLILDQTKTVLPNEGLNGAFEVRFAVDGFVDGQLSCALSEDAPPGYAATYTCLGESECAAAQSTSSCTFNAVSGGSDNLCQVQNYPQPVTFTVNKQWLFEAEQIGIQDTAHIRLECTNAWDGDGQSHHGSMVWTWPVTGNGSKDVLVYPDFDGSTQCRATEKFIISAVESDEGCADWMPVLIGDGSVSCTIVNTVFLEGIPTLSDYGLLVFAVLMLASGLVTVRRN